jgi:methyl-accepting chemotaxis protein
MLAFAGLLRQLEPVELGAGFSAARMLAQALFACGLGIALVNWLAGDVLRALDDRDEVVVAALAAAHRLPVLFTVGSFAVWMVLALIGLLVGSSMSGPTEEVGRRLGAFAAIGLIAAAVNALLAARVVAPVCTVLVARMTAEQRGKGGRPMSLAWSLRLMVVALVFSPAMLGGLLERARVLRGAGDGPFIPTAVADAVLFPLGLMAVGFVLVEVVASALRHTATALRDSAHGMKRGVGVYTEAELAEASVALAGLAAATHGVVVAFETAAQDLVDGLAELDTSRAAVAEKTAVQVSGVQQLTESVSSLYSHSESIESSIQELRTAVGRSSSTVTELGVAGERLAGTAGELLRSAETASTSIQGVLARVGEIAGSTDVLAGVALEASSTMEEMAASMRGVNESAERCSELSDQVVRVADDGSKVVQETIDGMQAIRDATGTAEGVIRGLGDRAGEIGAIVDVIDGVANETSLLALNAAIIAAQAGEHGRGFSVVAGEIRELATRVSSSTAEITDLIRSVQDESANAIGAIERGAQSVASGVDLSAQAGRSLIEITRVARSSKKLVEGIVHSVSEQTKAAGHVVGVIEEVNAQAERIRSAACDQQQGNDTVLEHAKAMKEMAHQVHRTADEQSLGTHAIVQTVERIGRGLRRIGASAKKQTERTQSVVASSGDAYRCAVETSEAAGGLGPVSDRLRAAIDAARGTVGDLDR